MQCPPSDAGSLRCCTAALLLALTLSLGCQARYEYTLNPDGSGRLTFSHDAPEAGFKAFRDAESALTGAAGIAGWEDVSIQDRGPAGHTFKGTAYFGDVNKFRLRGPSYLQPTLKDNPDGTKTLTIRHDRWHDYRPRKAMTEAKVQEMIAKVRADHIKRLQDPNNAAWRRAVFTVVIDPPGKVRTAINMKQRDDGKLEVTYPYAKVQDALGVILNDKRAVREFVSAGESLIKFGPVLTRMVHERVFGVRADVMAIIEPPFNQKFDYKQAVADAEKDRGKVVQTAGFIPKQLPAKEAPGRLTNLRDVKALRYGETIALGFKGTLPTPSRYGNGAEFYRVTGEHGNVLLPAEGTRRHQHNVSIDSKDQRTVSVSIALKNVPKDTKRLKRVVGVVRYRDLGNLFAQSLGTITPRTGTRLPKHGFEVTTYGYDKRGNMVFNWRAQAPPNLAMAIFREGKTEFLKQEIEPEPNTRVLERPFRWYGRKAAPPKRLEVIFLTATQIKITEAPFVLEDLPIEVKKP